MKFVVFVEGKTEQLGIGEWLKRWIDTRLKQKIAIQIVKFSGWSHFIDEIEKKARLHLEGPKAKEIIAAIGLLDLYIPEGFYPNHLKLVPERYHWAKPMIEEKVHHDKFHMFFSVHEVEAWLLSQPDIFHYDIRNKIDQKSKEPEKVNFDAPPAIFLKDNYKKFLKIEYKKAVHGPNLFRKLNPEIAYAKCPYLKQMLDEMESLAHQAGL